MPAALGAAALVPKNGLRPLAPGRVVATPSAPAMSGLARTSGVARRLPAASKKRVAVGPRELNDSTLLFPASLCLTAATARAPRADAASGSMAGEFVLCSAGVNVPKLLLPTHLSVGFGCLGSAVTRRRPSEIVTGLALWFSSPRKATGMPFAGTGEVSCGVVSFGSTNASMTNLLVAAPNGSSQSSATDSDRSSPLFRPGVGSAGIVTTVWARSGDAAEPKLWVSPAPARNVPSQL